MTYWNGSVSDDFYNAENWSGGAVPQGDTCQEANVSGTADQPGVAVANAPAYGQIHSLTIGDYGTLKITATGDQDSAGYVFSAESFQIFQTGQLIVDTASPVELGQFTEMSGTLTIRNNDGHVVLDGNRLSGNGSLNLINSTLGSEANPVNIDESMHVTMQGGSTLYAGFYADGASVTFDPASQNTIVLNGYESTINTAFSGVSENTHFAINGAHGVVPVKATFQAGSNDGYELVIDLSGGKTLTLSQISVADGFVPGAATIGRDAAGDYVITDTNAAATPANYAQSDIHAQLQNIVTGLVQAGGDPAQYSTNGYSNHNASAANHFTGAGTASQPAEWGDDKNWSLGNTPQEQVCEQGVLQGTASQPLYVVADQPDIRQFTSLSIYDNATLTVTAPAGQNSDSYVFATQGVEIRGNGALVIDTAARVELGGVTEIEGTLTIRNNDGNVVLDGSRLSGSGTLDLDHSTLGTPGTPGAPVRVDMSAVNLSNDSTLYAGFYATGNTVDFDGSHNTVVLTGYENSIGTAFNNVGPNTAFGINVTAGEKPVSAVYSANQDGGYTLTITLDNGKTLSLTNIHTADGFVPEHTSFSTDANGDWLIDTTGTETCFLEGTLIRTERGNVAVEALVVGDRLAVAGAGTDYRTVVWVGHRDVEVAAGRADAVYPVRIVRGAFAENVPSRDLLVTPEHCLYVDGGFVPVRMLVNGGSIFHDTTIASYRYFHVEAEVHSVIFAEDLPTESYLDTGNRRAFSSGGVVSIVSRGMSWADAAAPLVTDVAVVGDVHRRLVARAASLGLDCDAGVVTTDDPDLVATAENGAVLRRVRQQGGQVVFELPAGVTRVRLFSRADRPADAVGAFCDDRRMLGVLVGQVTLWDPRETRSIRSHLEDASLPGWHAIEHSAMRWTDGAAVLELGARSSGDAGVLSVQIVTAGPYRMQDVPAVARRA
ncbi:outer membrane protein [Neoasaia chiangmaiensis NBRC 101099]|nr:Hint domain-containing protein [Neoasaia chiangmaiensis]GBR39036.1 outer membrane protein [Neoasaia chiangmaiensis NBRC 101099]GEN15586.1 hypothetical protein NCH01_20170 [Neoasaia chiangmaiensis]